MPGRPRQGQNWSNAPIPATRGPGGGGPMGPGREDAPLAHVVPVKDVNVFFSQFPPDGVAKILAGDEVRYDHSLGVNDTLVVGRTISIPQSQAWLVTDVDYYAQGPAKRLMGAPVFLDEEALVGLLRFDLILGRVPTNDDTQRMAPYASAGQTSVSTAGWPWLRRSLGPRNVPGWAVVARGGAGIRLTLTVEEVPRYPITKIGYNIRGVQISESQLARLWR